MTRTAISEFVLSMVATNDLERELMALAETHDPTKLERLEAQSLALSKVMRAVFANVTSISIH